MDLFENIPYGIEDIITDSMTESIIVSPSGALFPMLDTAAIIAIWAKMLYKIADYHDVSLTTEECVKIITAGSSCYLGYLGCSKTLSWLLNFIPGGIFGAMAGNVIFNGYYTYALGKAFHLMLEDYDINGKTIFEISKILINLFVPVPSPKTLKAIFSLMKAKLNL